MLRRDVKGDPFSHAAKVLGPGSKTRSTGVPSQSFSGRIVGLIVGKDT